MNIKLPEDLERSINAEVRRGQYGSADELIALAVRSFLGQPRSLQDESGLGSIGAMRDADDELDEIVAEAYRKRQEDTWRDIAVE